MFLSVPPRLRLSSTVTRQPARIMWSAALTPRNPAPPVISSRRGEGTSACRQAAEVRHGHDPCGAGEKDGLSAARTSLRIEEDARQEEHGEYAVHDVQQ